MQFRRMLAMINFISLTIRCLSTPFIFYCAIFSFDNYPISGRQTRICAHNLMDTFSLADETVVLYLYIKGDELIEEKTDQKESLRNTE